MTIVENSPAWPDQSPPCDILFSLETLFDIRVRWTPRNASEESGDSTALRCVCRLKSLFDVCTQAGRQAGTHIVAPPPRAHHPFPNPHPLYNARLTYKVEVCVAQMRV